MDHRHPVSIPSKRAIPPPITIVVAAAGPRNAPQGPRPTRLRRAQPRADAPCVARLDVAIFFPCHAALRVSQVRDRCSDCSLHSFTLVFSAGPLLDGRAWPVGNALVGWCRGGS